MKILVVDDKELNLEAARQQFQGHDLKTADSYVLGKAILNVVNSTYSTTK